VDLDVPRLNGELVFDEPWQSRAFGMAVALHRSGAFEWDEFRDHLIREIAEGSGVTPYYESWLAAFERLLVARALIDAAELEGEITLSNDSP